MSLLRWVADRFGAPPDPVADAQAMVTVATSPSYRVPILREVLASHGIESEVVDELHPGTWEQRHQIRVRQADRADADRVLTDFGRS